MGNGGGMNIFLHIRSTRKDSETVGLYSVLYCHHSSERQLLWMEVWMDCWTVVVFQFFFVFKVFFVLKFATFLFFFYTRPSCYNSQGFDFQYESRIPFSHSFLFP